MNNPIKSPAKGYLAAAAACLVAFSALTFCTAAPAQDSPPTLTAESGGVRVVIHRDDTANCPAPGRRAQFFPKEGPSIEGCWVLAQDATGRIFVRVNWIDGDRDDIPVGEFVKPQSGV